MAQNTGANSSIPVTPDNFVRAESDTYIAGMVKVFGLGKLGQYRTLTPIDRQTVVRSNRDTLYSAGVFDLDAGPVTITLPDAGTRFRSVFAVNEDNYAQEVTYKAGSYTLARDKLGTRYVLVAVRTLVDPNNPDDIAQVHALQDGIKVSQKGSGNLELPNWDPVSLKKVRDALLALGETLPDTRHTFGTKDEVWPVRHLIGTATLWGGNPTRDAIYLTVTPPRNDGATMYKVTVKNVPVDGFWSISVYNAKGFFDPNPYNAYTLNNITGKKSPDGSITVQFGGCDGKIPNCLPIEKDWNYTVRLYRPRAEILSGKWTFPKAETIN